MTDHIKAAKEAGFDWTDLGVQDRLAFERFYAIAFKAGMERAAEICDAKYAIRARALGSAILNEAHAQNQPKTTHDGSVV